MSGKIKGRLAEGVSDEEKVTLAKKDNILNKTVINDASVSDSKNGDAEDRRIGIGVLGEKTIHAFLKDSICSDKAFQEIKVGSYYADVLVGGQIFEVQTQGFDKLRRKLDVFLQEYHVTVVYPIPREKWLIWIDPTTGETSKPRKSPARGTYYSAFKELYKIKMYLNSPHLSIRLVLLDVEEYRLQIGWSADGKKGSVRFDRQPKAVAGDLELRSAKDYESLVPDALRVPEEGFTTKDFAAAAKIRKPLAQVAVNVLCGVGALEKVGKSGRMILYKCVGSKSRGQADFAETEK